MDRLRLHICTWNVGGSETISEKTCLQLLNINLADPVDIYVVSLQEIGTGVFETAKSFVAYDDWATILMTTLSKYDYYMVESVRVQGISLSLFTRLSHLPFIRFIKTDIVRTGLAGNWGNKGGVAISARIYGEKVCFLDTHLPPSLEQDEARVETFYEIVDRLDFANTDTLLSHDVIFWAGDLNFRINDLCREAILDRIEKESYSELLTKDQLNHHLSQKRVMSEFVEGEITFPPSYKFDYGTDTYDTSLKERKPAWTDRILYRVNPELRSLADLGSAVSQMLNKQNPSLCDYIEQIKDSYQSHMEFRNSDHKPVSAQYSIRITKDDEPMAEITAVGLWQNNKEGRVIVTYKKGMFPEENDYLALYEENITDFRSYKTWVYLPMVNPAASITNSCQTCDFPAVLVDTTIRFRVGYYSSRMSCLLAISEPFEIRA